MAVTYERSETSKKRLKMRWDHPVPIGEEQLDFQSALKELRGDDPRPLLVLRDCDRCKGKDDALLSKTLNNERTLLFTQFFHCIKTDRRIVEEGHPWHALFAGDKPPHLFVSTWDGTNVMPLPGTQTQKKLWSTLTKVLSADYKKDARTAVRNWLRTLDKFDALESRKKELQRQLDEQLEKGKKKRGKSIEKKLAKIRRDFDSAYDHEAKLMDLILRHAPKAKTVSDFDAEAASEVKATGGGLLERIRKGKKKSGDSNR